LASDAQANALTGVYYAKKLSDTPMISPVFSRLRRWLSVLLTLILALTSQFTLTSCDPTALKTEAAQVSQWVTSTISDPKTFNYAFNQEFPHVFLFTTEGLTTLNGITGKVEPALAEAWETKSFYFL